MSTYSSAFVVAVASVLLLAAPPASAAPPDPSCRAGVQTSGPFSYSPADLGAHTFVGHNATAAEANFTITAPGGPGDTVFPAQSNGPCQDTASAEIRVFGIDKVADGEGNMLAETVEVPTDSPLGLQIAAAFFLDPSSHLFGIGETLAVKVSVSNPMVGAADFGDYVVTLKAQAIGAGIGVGSGTRYMLGLRAPAVTDAVPPTVTITKPTGDEVLGPVSVEIAAVDPVPGTGVNWMGATISSAGNTVSNLAIPLTLDQSLPVAAGVTVTGTGTFSPTGGTGTTGTILGIAFTSAARSGIGSYTLTASATDVAGYTGSITKAFKLTYAVEFPTAFAPPSCAGSSNNNCTGQFQFTLRRSSVTSDGAFMVDQTVRVELVNTATNAIVATHTYGTGDIKAVVQIDTVAFEYKTHFRRADFGASSPATYVARISCRDVDNQWMLQGTSASVTF
jgi:hypothetical protein